MTHVLHFLTRMVYRASLVQSFHAPILKLSNLALILPAAAQQLDNLGSRLSWHGLLPHYYH